MNPIITTGSGKKMDLHNPASNMVCLADIARSLARQSRFSGHTKGLWPYSVAQHSIWVAKALQTLEFADENLAMKALLNDAHISYTGLVSKPLRSMIPEMGVALDKLTKTLQSVVFESFGVEPLTSGERQLIDLYDNKASALEAWCLAPDLGRSLNLSVPTSDEVKLWQRPMAAQEAQDQFWTAHCFLNKGISLERLTCV